MGSKVTLAEPRVGSLSGWRMRVRAAHEDLGPLFNLRKIRYNDSLYSSMLPIVTALCRRRDHALPVLQRR